MENPITKLNRFTTLPILLDMLERKKLTLLNPRLWEDKNDSEIILEYKSRKGIENLFALCFSHDDETIHHWKTYSNGPSGCVIEFDAKKLFAILDEIPGLKHGKIIYKKIDDVSSKKRIELDDVPFTKRWPYRCEEEYRIIYETNEKMDFYEIEFPLSVIRKVTISQQMPEQIYNTIKKHLKGTAKDPDKRISRSTLYENQRWISGFKKM
ncbi:DUF2971 domain-containing protein [Flavobacterium sp. AG291]|uniref:DUF2971 domain-containing protein n=1 Tax=Flavobacterium sp. AG291 TaxID=2184000 RepID=UPI000E0C2C16|nr:DUF2971 domain-containing protein [Flavobacterium sp. AG291]RDI04535.1 DUF2971 family protein [Flavobacterium sp. AG291]